MKRSKVCRKALKNWNKKKYSTHGICYCLDNTAEDYGIDVMLSHNWYHEISRHMRLSGYVKEWLMKQGVNRLAMTDENMYEYRALWLERLIEHYKSIGD